MTLVPFAEANVLHLKSLRTCGPEKERLFDMSIKKFEASINTSPDRFSHRLIIFIFSTIKDER
jgi:hypothetical protein